MAYNKNYAPKNQKPQKPKLVITNYEKPFETLEQMVEELKTLHTEFTEIFYYDSYEDVSPNALIDDAIEYFKKNCPDVVEGKNLPVSISVNANGVTLKTSKFFTVKWSYKYDRNGFITDIVSAITVFSREDYDRSEFENKLSKDWKVVPNFNNKR